MVCQIQNLLPYQTSLPLLTARDLLSENHCREKNSPDTIKFHPLCICVQILLSYQNGFRPDLIKHPRIPLTAFHLWIFFPIPVRSVLQSKRIFYRYDTLLPETRGHKNHLHILQMFSVLPDFPSYKHNYNLPHRAMAAWKNH